MADAVSTTVIKNEGSEYVVHLTNASDGTGESNVVKVDKSTLTVSGVEPSTLSLMSARWAIQGFAKVTLIWDHDTDVTAMILTGSGFEDFSSFGGKQDAGTGGTGDLLLTAPAGATTGSYDITLVLKKK
jgi:hypothetical protein